jgi:2-dehydropantoate 2-reductase
MGFRIAIVGSGAIGIHYGAHLAHGGSDVHFLMRGDLGEVRRNGLYVRGKGSSVRVADVNCYNSTNEIGQCDLVIIAVKATSNGDLVDLIPPLLHDRTALLTLQNGLGNEEFLAGHFSAERVLGGLCFICVTRISRTEVEAYDSGTLVIGEYARNAGKRTHAIASQFATCGINCSVTDDLAFERWRKLVWNIPFNALSILAGGISTAGILGNDGLRRATLALMDEVVDAANTCGHALDKAVAQEYIKHTEVVGAFKPSTLSDWEERKPLELQAIWGEPLRRATAAGAKMPRLEIIYALLKSLEATREARQSP